MSGNRAKLEDLQKVLLEVVKSENLRDPEILLKDITEKGDGYVGLISFIEIKAKTEEGRDATLDLVVKSAPTSEKLRLDMPIRAAFETENYMYSVVHQKFRRFQKEHGVTKPFDSLAKCYVTNNNQLEESLVMENLRTSGYKLWNRKIPMNKEHVTFVLKEYGKLHSLSYALKTLDPAAFGKLTSGLNSSLIAEFFKKSSSILIKLYENVVKSFNQSKDSKLVQNMRNFQDNMMNFLLVESVKVDKYSIITHGDCWTNNMMFKYENPAETEEPSRVCLLDWQCSTLSSPVIDLAYFFYCCSSPEFLDDLDDYLQVYYSSFSNHLEKFGLDAREVFPFSELEDQWKVHSKFGFVMATMIIKAMVSDTHELPDIAAAAEDGQIFEAMEFKTANEGVYFERMEALARHFHARNLF